MATPIKVLDLPFKKIAIFAAATIGALVIFAIVVGAIFFAISFRTYENKTEGFSIKYPGDWKVVERNQPGAIVGFVSPKEGPLDTFLENIAITKTDLSKRPMTMKEYTDLTIKQMTAIFNNIKVVESADLLLSRHLAHKFVFFAAGDRPSTIVVYGFIDHETAYNITYVGNAKRYAQKDKPLIDFMMNTLKVMF
ncbi:MAG: hypothetical protein HQL16_00080 [Candidatus Omnitrophica bacterium]|nr:hypothetical protein [Candidatus Omnitrophota bacterium]